MAIYKIGGFLREHVNTGILVLLILYTIFLFLPIIIIDLLRPLLFNLPIIWFLFIRFFIEVGFLILLWQIIVPLGLKLPNGKQTFRQHSFSIGLTRVKPLWKNLIIGIGSFIILGFSALLIGEIFGNYIFIPEILIADYNWMILFVFMLIPGIWEEIAFRGVILNLQVRKYSKTTVILLNGILFGLFHFINILFGQSFGQTLIQVISGSCIGISFAYMYIKTNSLLPSIILHYLIDAVGSIFQTFVFPNSVNLVLFKILGFGVFPMILIVFFVFLLTRDKVDVITKENK